MLTRLWCLLGWHRYIEDRWNLNHYCVDCGKTLRKYQGWKP